MTPVFFDLRKREHTTYLFLLTMFCLGILTDNDLELMVPDATIQYSLCTIHITHMFL